MSDRSRNSQDYLLKRVEQLEKALGKKHEKRSRSRYCESACKCGKRDCSRLREQRSPRKSRSRSRSPRKHHYCKKTRSPVSRKHLEFSKKRYSHEYSPSRRSFSSSSDSQYDTTSSSSSDDETRHEGREGDKQSKAPDGKPIKFLLLSSKVDAYIPTTRAHTLHWSMKRK